MDVLAFCNDDVMIQIKWWRSADLAISPLVGQHFRGAPARRVKKKKAGNQGDELEASASIEIVKHTLLSCGQKIN